MSSVKALPAPGPATIRLALLRTGIEIFGENYTRNIIFPTVRARSIYIRPPEQVSLSNQTLRAYKGDPAQQGEDALVYREVAHATGPVTIYLDTPQQHESIFNELLMAIGYWGTADSLVYCNVIHRMAPTPEECITPLRRLTHPKAIRPFFTCLVAELCRTSISWHELMPMVSAAKQDVFRIEVYIWPMVICNRDSSGTNLSRCSFVAR